MQGSYASYRLIGVLSGPNGTTTEKDEMRSNSLNDF